MAPNDGDSGSPSLSHRNKSGLSPLDTPQTVRVLMLSARPSWKMNGSITGGTILTIGFMILSRILCLFNRFYCFLILDCSKVGG